MKEYSIGSTCTPCVGFKYGCHEDKGIPCVLASRSSVWRYICDMIKKKKWRWSSYVELNISHALAYGLSNEWSRSWVLDSKWRILYTPQDSMIEHEKIQGWPIQRVKNRFKFGQHMKHEECAT